MVVQPSVAVAFQAVPAWVYVQTLLSVLTDLAGTQVIAGAVTSAMVTVELQVAALPFTSVTVSITVFGPLSAQVKAVLPAVRVAMPQASVDPLSICEAVMVAWPVPSRGTVISWQ